MLWYTKRVAFELFRAQKKKQCSPKFYVLYIIHIGSDGDALPFIPFNSTA